MRVIALAMFFAGCGSSNEPQPMESSTAISSNSWVQTIAKDGQAFGDLIEEHRDDWIAFYRAEWGSVNQSGSTVLRYRSHAELAGFYHRLARITRYSWAKTEEIWTERPETPPKEGLRDAAILARASGHLPTNVLEAISSLPSPLQAEAKSTLAMDATTLAKRALEGANGSRDSGVRIQDPIVFQALANHHREELTKLPTIDGLGGSIFSRCGTAPNRLVEPTEYHPYACLEGALLSEAGLSIDSLGLDDDAQLARELGRKLDDHVDMWSNQLQTDASEDGRQLLADLQITAAYRSATLTLLAEYALDSDRPKQALALVQMAQDMSTPREIGPINTPLFFAVQAEASLRSGRIREALEPLEILAQSYPEVAGLDEAVGDLSVLNGMNRQGDSKEL